MEHAFPLPFPWNDETRQDKPRFFREADGWWRDPTAYPTGQALVQCVGDLLTALPDFRLVSLTGSAPIMANAEAIVAVPEGGADILRKRFGDIARIYADSDPNVTLTLTPCDLPAEAPDGDASRKMALAISLLRSGQCRVDAEDPRTTVTSAVLMRTELTGGDFILTSRMRSTCGADQQLHFERAQQIMALLGMELKLTDG